MAICKPLRDIPPQGVEIVAIRWRWPGYRWTYEDYRPDQLHSGGVEVQRLVLFSETHASAGAGAGAGAGA